MPHLEHGPSPPNAKPSIWKQITRPSGLYPFYVCCQLFSTSTIISNVKQGILYFFAHPFLYPLLRTRLLPCLLLSVAVFALLFTFAYLPQALLLLPFHGRAAWFNATILVLGEGATLTALLFEAFFVDATLVDVFDAVLVAKGHELLVSRGREVLLAEEPDEHRQAPAQTALSHPTSERNPLQRLGPTHFSPVYSPFSALQITEFILLLPLNFVPIIGVPAFLLLTGARGGPLHHHRYFKLRGLHKKERRKEVKQRNLQYTWFGTGALALQLIPGLSMLFLLTTAAGSALWVADLEADLWGSGGEVGDDEEREALTPRAETTYGSLNSEG